ncbi:MAG: hypothetical protein HC896_00155 [Bacteroidales bacterium]|nr:hypothetical protein [Bacteroidales bacterium]
MRQAKVDFLQEALHMNVSTAVDVVLEGPFSNENPYSLKPEYDAIKSMLEDLGETGIPEFEEEFFLMADHMKKAMDRDSLDYWAEKGEFRRKFLTKDPKRTYELIRNSLTEYIVRLPTPPGSYDRRFLETVARYIDKLYKQKGGAPC